MHRTVAQTWRAALGILAVGISGIIVVALRPAPAVAQNGGGNSVSAVGGPIRLSRGQTARLSAFVPAALRGPAKPLDMKFAINDGSRWFVVSKTFLADDDCPWASVELAVTLNGAVVFQGEVMGHLPAGVATIDITGHEITHGVSGSAPETACALEIRDTESGRTTATLTVRFGGGAY